MSSTSAAAWVQAVGTIVAIIVSVLISSRQTRDQIEASRRLIEEQRHKKDISLLDATQEICSRAIGILLPIKNHFSCRDAFISAQGGGLDSAVAEKVQFAQSLLDAIPWVNLPGDFAGKVIAIKLGTAFFHEDLQEGIKTALDSSDTDIGQLAANLSQYFASMTEDLQSMRQEIKNFRRGDD